MAIEQQSTRRRDAVTFLIDEHAEVEELFVRYQAADAGSVAARRRQLMDQIVRELRVHAAMEEESFYPSIRQVVAEGDSLVEESLHEHAEAKALLAELEAGMPGERDFDTKAESLISDVRHHVKEEEGDILPRLKQSVGETWLIELGRELERTKARLLREMDPDQGVIEVEPLLPC